MCSSDLAGFEKWIERRRRERPYDTVTFFRDREEDGIAVPDEESYHAWLPAYAPDLNPVEHLWSHTKYGDLANYVPQDTFDLRLEADAAIDKTSRCAKLMRSFFHGAELPV